MSSSLAPALRRKMFNRALRVRFTPNSDRKAGIAAGPESAKNRHQALTLGVRYMAGRATQIGAMGHARIRAKSQCTVRLDHSIRVLEW